MKKIFLIFFIMQIVVQTIIAQKSTTVYYDYDARGNRTIRYSEQNKTKQDSTVFQASELDTMLFQASGLETDITRASSLSEYIKIFPNPTKGKINLQITGITTDKNDKLQIYNTNGKMILEQQLNIYTTKINLTDFARGTYLLKIFINENTYQKTIIKL